MITMVCFGASTAGLLTHIYTQPSIFATPCLKYLGINTTSRANARTNAASKTKPPASPVQGGECGTRGEGKSCFKKRQARWKKWAWKRFNFEHPKKT